MHRFPWNTRRSARSAKGISVFVCPAGVYRLLWACVNVVTLIMSDSFNLSEKEYVALDRANVLTRQPTGYMIDVIGLPAWETMGPAECAPDRRQRGATSGSRGVSDYGGVCGLCSHH